MSLKDINLTENELSDITKGEPVVSYQVDAFSENSVGFLGNHYRLRIETANDIHTFFVKIIPKVDMHAKYVEEIGAFKKEVFLYKTLMKELQEMKVFGDKQWSPICHFVKDDVLVFEDLSEKKYSVGGIKGILDLDHARAAIQALARFHASSVMWENTNQVKISDKYPNAASEVCYGDNETRKRWLTCSTEALEYLTEELGYTVEREKFHQFVKDAIKTVVPSKENLNVLSHGDLWTSNLMFSYTNEGTVENCIIVDYQLARYAPCTVDLICMITLILSSENRKKYIDFLCYEYYIHLSKILDQHSIVITELLKLDDFLKNCTFYRKMGLIEACLYGTIIYLPEELSTEILSTATGCHELTVGDKYKICLKAFNSDDFYKTRMTELLDDLMLVFENK